MFAYSDGLQAILIMYFLHMHSYPDKLPSAVGNLSG